MSVYRYLYLTVTGVHILNPNMFTVLRTQSQLILYYSPVTVQKVQRSTLPLFNVLPTGVDTDQHTLNLCCKHCHHGSETLAPGEKL